MPILVDESKRVIVQGITGREGSARTKLMLQYGTKVVGGCSPGKQGQVVNGLPVFSNVRDLCNELGEIDISVIFVPAPSVKTAALEALDADIKLIAIIADRVPLYDVLEICEVAEKKNARFIGPNTVGVMSPGKAVLGMMGGSAEAAKQWFNQGNIGIVSRSGGLSASVGYYISREGLGLSTICHIGGDSIVGLTLPEVIKLFQNDTQTEIIVMIGEIGGTQEEQVAELYKKGEVNKPIIAYVGGRAAKNNVRYSHSGAIIEGKRGTWQDKVECLRDAGIEVIEDFYEIAHAVKYFARTKQANSN
ncbi:MAG TPA: succinate--CoA ligase subunit alpha [Candidatus Nitrosotenuis sp.]|nr:succinate--CoA ligase subunit alpha [Candidatus Nitrosotenuis sp.]